VESKITPQITFSIEHRSATEKQLDAGKRLFKRLIERVRENPEGTGKPEALRLENEVCYTTKTGKNNSKQTE
jgi:Txe/YoeB family toxin of Txe-Axe toxin-antitoxin module